MLEILIETYMFVFVSGHDSIVHMGVWEWVVYIHDLNRDVGFMYNN